MQTSRLLKTIRHEPVDATPIWIMRQAGRYLPEYRKVREQAGSFMKLCQTPELACEVTLQPLRRYDLDASILFSDILTIPDALGLGLHFKEGEGPIIEKPVQTEAAFKQLPTLDLEKLDYVYQTIRLLKSELPSNKPLIGFCGSPWTVACYSVEGKSAPGFPKIMQMLREQPSLLQQLLDQLAVSIHAHLQKQIESGVDVVMLFDTWGGMLNDETYQTFSLQYLQKIIHQLKAFHTPIILFTKNGAQWIDKMLATQCDVIGLDWTVKLEAIRKKTNGKAALQGNMNPAILLESPDIIRKEVLNILKSYGSGSGHIFNLGHGITPDVPVDHVQVLVDAVHELSQSFHR